jgi:hypothetical protein
MKKIALGILLLFLSTSINAQSKKNKDKKAIKEMCGCFEVTFNFAETFNYSEDENYKPSKNKISKGLEWAGLVTDDKNKISIQHILQVGNPAEPMIVKHWRQDWLYQNTDFYMFNGDNNWRFTIKDKKRRKETMDSKSISSR